jgi:hypothetical protein
MDPDWNVPSVPLIVCWTYGDLSGKLDISSPSVAGIKNAWSYTFTPCLRHRGIFYQTSLFCVTKFPVWEGSWKSRLLYCTFSVCFIMFILPRSYCNGVRRLCVCTWLARFSAKCFSPFGTSSHAAVQILRELKANYTRYLCNCWSNTDATKLCFWKYIFEFWRIKIYHALAFPILLYGSENFTLRKKDKRRLTLTF